MSTDAFWEFERAGWERAAEHYERAWLGDTQAYVEPRLDAAGVGEGMRLLDVASGPGIHRVDLDGNANEEIVRAALEAYAVEAHRPKAPTSCSIPIPTGAAASSPPPASMQPPLKRKPVGLPLKRGRAGVSRRAARKSPSR